MGLVANAEIFSYLKHQAQSLPSIDVLQQSVDVLLGVNDAAKGALNDLGIESIFDLATSVAFSTAQKIVSGGTDPRSSLYRFGKPPADLVRVDHARGISLQELQHEPIIVLSAIPEDAAGRIAQALDVASVRDLVFYPPFVAASKILKALYFPETDAAYDPELPTDLVPKTGEYPIEKVQYATLHMGEIKNPGRELTDVLSPDFTPPALDVLAKLEKDGFKTVATGALLTFTQSWFAQGITLGHLLHSATLAPGESTRVAVVDWSRKERGNQIENISQQEDLVNDADHTRAIAEVTHGVATEAQMGFSSSNTNATSESSGVSTSAEASGGLLGAVFGGPSFAEGSTNSNSSSDVHSDSFSATFGNKEVSTQAVQNINDRTHQHAHGSRNKRASVVKEVSQSEHENVSTRVIANYNHSHALSINYYEVVQIFRVEVRLAKAEQVIFVPLSLPNFEDASIVRRFQVALTRAALNPQVRQAMMTMDTIQLDPVKQTSFAIFRRPLGDLLREALATRSSLTAGTRFLASSDLPRPTVPRTSQPPAHSDGAPAAEPGAARATGDTPDTPSTSETETSDQPSSPIVTAAEIARPARFASFAPSLSHGLPIIMQTNKFLWDQDHVSRLSNLFGSQILRPTTTAINLPADCVIEGATVEGNFAAAHPVKAGFKVSTTEETITDFGPGQDVDAIHMRDLSRIVIHGSSPDTKYDATITLTVNRGGIIVPVKLPTVVVPRNAAEAPVVNVSPGGINSDITKHLMANRMYYSQVVFRSLDATDLALVLSGYGYKLGEKVVPITQIINPRPVRYVGNYLAFTTNIKSYPEDDVDPTWTQFLVDHHIEVGYTTNDVVPLGSGGVFAEAVLGRANCAEKLDISRFWDWKESPIPLQPTEIAAIRTGTRATQEDLAPGQLDNPIISQQVPSALPDPVGTAALLAAIQNGNMFRDQSGLAATIGLTQAALQGTQQGAAAAGQTASQNLQSQLQATTERQKTAANMITDLAKTAASMYTRVPLGGGGGSGGSASNSGKGALINYFDKTQGGPGTTGSGGQRGGVDPAIGGGSGGSAGGTPSSGPQAAVNGATPAGFGFSQNPAARSAIGGDDVLSNVLNKATDMAGTILGTANQPPPNQVLNQRKAWPKLNQDEVLPHIDVLKADSWCFNQGSVGLCTAGAFFFHCFTLKPQETADFAKTLFGMGQASLGRLNVRPGDDLRNADYSAIFANSNIQIVPPQADWMVMCSVRDSTNWFIDFEGDPDESIATSTSNGELEGWYNDTGFFSSVVLDNYAFSDPSIATLRALTKTSTNGIALTVKIKVLRSHFQIDDGWIPSRHVIGVTSTPVIDEAAGTIKFEYWTWGKPPRELQEDLDFVRDCICAIFVVTL